MGDLINTIISTQTTNPQILLIQVLSLLILYLISMNLKLLSMVKQSNEILENNLNVSQQIGEINTHLYILLSNQESENLLLSDVKNYLELLTGKPVQTHHQITKFPEELQ